MSGIAGPAGAGDIRRWRIYTLAPAVGIYLLLALLPIANLLAMSVHDIRWEQGAARWTFVGLRHFAALPGDPLVRAGLVNTLVFAVALRRGGDGDRLFPRAAREPRGRADASSTARSSCCRS